MTRARTYAIGLLLISQALAPLPVSAQDGFASTGGTQVSVEGSLVTITVRIDLALGGQGETTVPEGAQAEADGVAQEIANYWNQGFQRLSTDCLQFMLVVDIKVVPQADAHLLILGERRMTWVTTPGRHVVFWGVNNFGNAAPPETYDEYDEDGVAPPGEDYGTPFQHELWSMWSPQLEDSRDFAHEFGHLMGFGDDYANGEALPGREGTLMDGGDMVDQNLVNRLADLARESGSRLPGCWEGSGSFQQTPLKDGARELTRSAKFTFWFAVAQDGKVSGEITLTYAAKLTVTNLPQVEVGIAGFNPRVGGQVTDPNPTRIFPLEGMLDDEGLTLVIATPEEQRQQIEFTMRADPGVSAGLGLGGSLRTVPGGAGSVQVIQIEMMPFTPFVGPGVVQVGPAGAYAATFRESEPDSLIEWSAKRLETEEGGEPVG